MLFEKPIVYAVKHKDLNERMESRSGGIFTAISDYILDNNGVVYGCVLNENFQAVHIRTDNKPGRNKMRGSKYVQSIIGDTYIQAKEDLEKGRLVLFSGTSCQISGLKAYLDRDYDNLICIDIICHGVPSPKIWEEYIKWQEKQHKGKCVRVDFRNKKDYGWNSHVESLWLDNKDKQIDSKAYTKLFYSHNIIRQSCSKCPYKDVMHPADITIGDYWGIDEACPGFNDNKGVSLVLINNEKGKEFFELINDSIEIRECELEKSMQPPLKESYPKPSNYNKFWADVDRHSFQYILSKYTTEGKYSKLFKVLRKVKNRF